MSEELSNAASEWEIAGCVFLNAGLPTGDLRATVTDDFLYRRTGSRGLPPDFEDGATVGIDARGTRLRAAVVKPPFLP